MDLSHFDMLHAHVMRREEDVKGWNVGGGGRGNDPHDQRQGPLQYLLPLDRGRRPPSSDLVTCEGAEKGPFSQTPVTLILAPPFRCRSFNPALLRGDRLFNVEIGINVEFLVGEGHATAVKFLNTGET